LFNFQPPNKDFKHTLTKEQIKDHLKIISGPNTTEHSATKANLREITSLS